MNAFEVIEHAHGAIVYKHKKNDLKVILFPNSDNEVAGFQVTYHVGSRDEATGYTGATHLLEHLMFKGSKKFHKSLKNNIDQLENVGALLNATTWVDRTNYFEVLPKQHLFRAIEIEADRMRNAFIREEDRQAEMTVVRNEFEMYENDPASALHKELWSTAYIAHPYHHNTIGWLSDIENVSIERLKQFYDTFYWPNNATVTVMGDFDQEEVLQQIDTTFGKIEKSPHEMPEVYTTEPPQQGPRRFELKRKSSQRPCVGIAFKTPKGLTDEHLHLQLISSMLIQGRSSRLHQKLVSKGLAMDVFAEDYPNMDEGLFILYAIPTPKANLQQLEQLILEEVVLIKTKQVSTAELERVKKMIKAHFTYDRGSFFQSLSQVNEAIAIKDWRYYLDMPKRLEQITPKMIQETAKQYLLEDQSTTGHFIPLTEENA
ncbi:insulinase family protein [Gammaproteobacteria bacterium]|nr:insulinase family protein [Gammaproteobacteria bacterium]